MIIVVVVVVVGAEAAVLLIVAAGRRERKIETYDGNGLAKKNQYYRTSTCPLIEMGLIVVVASGGRRSDNRGDDGFIFNRIILNFFFRAPESVDERRTPWG